MNKHKERWVEFNNFLLLGQRHIQIPKSKDWNPTSVYSLVKRHKTFLVILLVPWLAISTKGVESAQC